MLPAVTIPAGQLAVVDAVRRAFGAPTFATVTVLVGAVKNGGSTGRVVITPGRTDTSPTRSEILRRSG